MEEFWGDITSTVGDGISNLLNLGLDTVADFFESEEYKFDNRKWRREYQTTDEEGNVTTVIDDTVNFFDALKGMLGEGSGGFVDKINKIVENSPSRSRIFVLTFSAIYSMASGSISAPMSSALARRMAHLSSNFGSWRSKAPPIVRREARRTSTVSI